MNKPNPELLSEAREASIDGQPTHRASGSIYLKQRAKGPVWYWRIRLPHGGEERKPIGPAWTKKRKSAEGYVSRREARARLEERLTDLRRGVGIPDRTGTPFRTAAEDWYSRGTTIGRPTRGPWKPAIRRDYRSALDRWLLPAFGDLKVAASCALSSALHALAQALVQKPTNNGRPPKRAPAVVRW